jgi:myo-inositol-1(or 4)-monophosphatase
MDKDQKSRLEVALRAARRAGSYLAGQYESANARGVYYKGRIDVVTACDYESQRLVVEEIRQAFPTTNILSEEGMAAVAPASHDLWVLDPLDGTTNFVHGVPHFAVSIAWQGDGVSQVGVICDALRDQLYWATLGGGAFRDGQPVHVAGTTKLDEALIASGFPYDIASTTRDNLREWAAVARRARSVRSLGAAALDMAWVACGRLDAHWELDLEPWDMAAGALLVEEAGGTVTGARGEPFDPYRRSLLASNGLVHAAILAAIGRNGDAEGNM